MKDAVPTASPDAKGDQLVVWPNNDKTQGYAIHNGSDNNEHPWNLLLVPTVRVNGIECPNLTSPKAPPYFKDAETQIGTLPHGGEDWVLTVNSTLHRGQNQLHIHMSKLFGDVRGEFDQWAYKAASDPSKWYDSTIKIKGFTYRGWIASSLDNNFFALLNDNVVKKSGQNTHMFDETILITRNTKGGYLVLSSDLTSDLSSKGGTDNSDWALDRDAKKDS